MTTQIAEKALIALAETWAIPLGKEGRKLGLAIIRAAIEEANKDLQTDLALAKQMCGIEGKRANAAESRAAPASAELRRGKQPQEFLATISATQIGEASRENTRFLARPQELEDAYDEGYIDACREDFSIKQDDTKRLDKAAIVQIVAEHWAESQYTKRISFDEVVSIAEEVVRAAMKAREK